MDELEKKAQELLEKGFAKNLQEAKTLAEKMIDEKAAGIVKTVTEAFEEKLKAQADANEKAMSDINVKLDEKDKAIEKALTDMNRIKEQDKKERRKTLASDISNALEQSEEQIKSFTQSVGGAKKSLDINVDYEAKAVGVMGLYAGTVPTDDQPSIGPAHELVHMRNAIPVSPTNRDVIKYIQYTKKEGAIGMVAPGAKKPKLDYNLTPKEAPVRKIAGLVDVMDEFLEDVPGSRDFLMQELPQALLDVEDFQILKGDGTGQNLTGLMTIATALSLPIGDIVTAASNHWDKLAAGLTQIRRANRQASAIWISPEDYLALLINKGSGSGEYTYPIIANAAGQISVAGVPVFQHNALLAGEALAGDFARGARIFQRLGAVINFSTENKENFENNLVTVRIEERLALAVYYPESFVKYAFGSPAPAV